MGLDNFVVYDLPKDGYVSLTLKAETAQLFKKGEFLSVRYNCVSFCGKCYNKFFEEIIGFTLYKDLKPKHCQEIYERLLEYMSELCALCKKIIEIGEHCWINRDVINEIIGSFVDFEWFRHPSYNELVEMVHFFKTCADNNLSIYASC